MFNKSFDSHFDIEHAQKFGFSWLSSQFSRANTFSVKELSNLILICLEKEEVKEKEEEVKNSETLLKYLLSHQNTDGCVENIRETARFVSILFTTFSKKQSLLPPLFQLENDTPPANSIDAAAHKSLTYLRSQKEKAEDDIYDLVYTLSAFGDAGVFEPELCLNLCERDNPDLQHPGTTALIITALQKQKNLSHFQEAEDALISEFIQKKINWLISERKNGFWKYTATSNLVIQSLILCGQKKKAVESLPWLVSSQKENGSWENDVNTTALSLLTL